MLICDQSALKCGHYINHKRDLSCILDFSSSLCLQRDYKETTGRKKEIIAKVLGVDAWP